MSKYTKGNKSAKGSMKGGDADSGSMGSNHGATGKLKKAEAGGAPGTVGTMGPVTTKNPFPHGLA
jgi:hypothetical protein